MSHSSKATKKKPVPEKSKAKAKKEPPKAQAPPPPTPAPLTAKDAVRPQVGIPDPPLHDPMHDKPPDAPKDPRKEAPPRFIRKVYSPADEALPYTYRARAFSLAPNTVQGILSPWPEVTEDMMVEYVLAFFKNVGVREVFGDDRDHAIKNEAEGVYADWLRELAGLSVIKPEARVAAARAALKKRGLLPTGDKE
jgi:hypothetical protein